MCEECSPEIQELARRIGTYTAAHEWSTPGLHIVLDDKNHETHFIQSSLDTENLDSEGKWIATELLKLSPVERHGVCQMAEDGSEIVNGVPGYHASWDDDHATGLTT
jgi:hypothetical protein